MIQLPYGKVEPTILPTSHVIGIKSMKVSGALWGPLFPCSSLATSLQDKGAEAGTESFVWPVNTVEIAFWEIASVRQLNLF